MSNDEKIPKLTKEKIQEMCKQFDFIKFYKTKPCIAFIVITQYDVIIISSNKKDEEYQNHSKMKEDLFDYMKLLNRLKYLNITCTCASTHKINLLTFGMDNLEGKKVITKEMIEAMSLIDELVSIIGENVIKGDLEEIKDYYDIKLTGNHDDLEETQLIGIPITKFINELKKQILKFRQDFETVRKKAEDVMQLD
ncbi:MAG TPA: hypothetical protein DEP51_04195 [Clostridiales bacterium]|nr:hypothetical protein [Clostridiales bacterium]